MSKPRTKEEKLLSALEICEEALAGFMASVGINGGYLDDEMKLWIQKQLTGKQRTPVSAYREYLELRKEITG